MICSKCHNAIVAYGEAYERVETFYNGQQDGNTKIYHPYCFIELAEEFAEDKARSKISGLERQVEDKHATIVKLSGDLKTETDRRIAADEALLLVDRDKRDKQLLTELTAQHAKVIELREQQMYQLVLKLEEAKTLALKGLESTDSGRFIMGQAALASDYAERLWAITWSTMWICVGRAINVERNIKELVDKHNAVASQCRTVMTSMEAQESEIAKLKAELGSTQESMMTAIKDRDFYKKERDSAQYDRATAMAEKRGAEQKARAVAESRDRLAAKLASLRSLVESTVDADEECSTPAEDFYRKFSR